MKLLYSQVKELIPDLSWSTQGLADKLSAIGHESEVVNDQVVDVTLTTNRKDCKDLNYLIFDLAGIYDLKKKDDLVIFNLVNRINVTLEKINKLLGTDYTEADYRQLSRLGFVVEKDFVTVPDFRTDMETGADVAEELIRLMGYKTLTPKMLEKESISESGLFEKITKIKYALVAAGLTETMTQSFAKVGEVELRNPFNAEEKYLRKTLLPGLLQTLAKNPYLKRAAFFEVGDIFLPDEQNYLGIILAGYKNIDSWVEKIEKAIGAKVELKPVDPDAAAKYDAKQSKIFFVEMPTEKPEPTSAVAPESITKPLQKIKPISKFPPLVADFTIPTNVEPDEIINAAQITWNNLLIIEHTDTYIQFPKSGEKSLTFRFIFQNMEKSFTQPEIESTYKAVADFLKPFGNGKI